LAPGLLWTGAENLAPTGIRSLERPGRNESLCRLRYPVPQQMELSGQIQDPGRLKLPVDIEREAGWHQSRCGCFGEEGNSVEPAVNRTPDSQAHSLGIESTTPSYK